MNYDVSLLEIKLFLMTTRFGSFSDVARRQDMTPSSVSRKMAQLEEKVGSKLLHRHTHSISLTEEGSPLPNSAPVAFGRLHIAPI